MIKAMYGGSMSKQAQKSNGNETVSYRAHATPIFTTQHVPEGTGVDDAILDRMVFQPFKSGSRDAATVFKFQELQMACDKGLTHLLIDIIKLRPKLVGSIDYSFKRCYAAMLERMTKEGLPNTSRVAHNHAALAAPLYALLPYMGLEKHAAIETLLEAIANLIPEHGNKSTGVDPASLFLEEVDSLIFDRVLTEGRHYLHDGNVLILRSKECYDAYAKKQRDHGRNWTTKGTLWNYLKEHPAHVEVPGCTKSSRKLFPIGGQSRAIAFNMDLLEDYSFGRNAI
jgi:hypothetical protein